MKNPLLLSSSRERGYKCHTWSPYQTHNSCLQSPDCRDLTPPSVFAAVGGKQAREGEKRNRFSWSRANGKVLLQFFWLSPERLWPTWGKGRLVKDRTSHTDLEWFSSPSQCPQLGNCLCIQALRGNGSEPLSSPSLYLSQLSIGWRNNVLSSLNLWA